MKLILTHDNADFDALASLLAAHKLDSAAQPILPQRLNRNVAHFLTLYTSALPFIRREELQRGNRVTHATVVDTQSFSTARGMRPDTPIHFIDHHPLTRDLAAHQTFTGETVGACTTLLVEQFNARRITIKPLEATLLLLGIYEDTGSLLYGTTTPRDIRCAAYLLECGADLDVVREFLQHRLSPEQRALYDDLRENAETLTINGHTIVLAHAQVTHPVDEIATLAHKLRELYEPSAVFVLVQLNGDIQLVARGTTDAIDVSAIAMRFGGGGHGRAAAALIRQRQLPAVRERILALLPTVIEALVRVEALMSVGVQTVPSTTRVKTVLDRMQQTGHEGFPVIEGGRVVGLLTRRDVDRAVRHGLGHQQVREIMEAGRYTVRPADSIETLQQLMMRTGWGQIPVVDDTGKLIGIVTRTDLIKRWGQRPDDGRRDEVLHLMRAAIPPGMWQLLELIAREAQAHHMGLYVVGGFVRDLLLDQPNHDVDLVVEGDAIALVRAIQATYGGDMRHHAQFGTAKWLPDEHVAAAVGVEYATAHWPTAVDFVSARTEFYDQPTALPTVQRGSIKLDLHRRDFTINTLAIRLAPEPMGDLLDFYGGEQDLQERVIRVLHSLSFVDDPTRMLRAVRLEQRLGFTIEPRSEELIRNALWLLERVSGDRLRHELASILSEPHPLRALARLERLGVLAALHPGLRVDDWVRGAFYSLSHARQQHPWPSLAEFDCWMLTAFSLFICRLPQKEVEQLGRRLQFSRAYLDHLHSAHTAIALLPELSAPQPPSAVVDLLDPIDDVGWLAAWAAAPTATARDLIAAYAQKWRFVKPTLTGRDIRELSDLKPGPVYGDLLHQLRSAWLDGVIGTAEEEHALLLTLVRNLGSAEK
ncbi:MAG: CBS domain-containing protein [Anaerolineae bacterium]|nr:CBS domain-containing protein [Anaerolineae bacterium]